MPQESMQQDRQRTPADEDPFVVLPHQPGARGSYDQYGVFHYFPPNQSNAGGFGVPNLGPTTPSSMASTSSAAGGSTVPASLAPSTGGAGMPSLASLIARYGLAGAEKAIEDIIRQKNEEANRALTLENERMRLALQQSGMDPNRQAMFQATDVARLERMGQPPPNYGPPAGSPYGSYISPSRMPTLSDTYLNTIHNAQQRISKGQGTAPDYTKPGATPPPPADLSQPWTAPPPATPAPTPPPPSPDNQASSFRSGGGLPGGASLSTPSPSAFLGSGPIAATPDPNDPNALSLARLLARYGPAGGGA